MKKEQKGFSVIEVLAILVIAGLLSAVIWSVYGHQSKTNKLSQSESSQTQTDGTKSGVKEIAKDSASTPKPLIIPNGWLKYDGDGVSFYHPADWKVQDTDMIESVAALVTFTDKNSVAVCGFLTMKKSEGYVAILQEVKSDKLVEGVTVSEANGFKVITYTAYGTSDKDQKNRSYVNVFFIDSKEFRLTTNPNILDDGIAADIMKTIQKN